jgi:hypothetical protein
MEQPPLEAPLEQQDDKILKEKRKNNWTDEARKKQSEHMKKVNAERIERARVENESKLQAEAEKIKLRAEMKLKEVEKKQETIKAVKEREAAAKEVPTSMKEEKALKKQKAKLQIHKAYQT